VLKERRKSAADFIPGVLETQPETEKEEAGVEK